LQPAELSEPPSVFVLSAAVAHVHEADAAVTLARTRPGQRTPSFCTPPRPSSFDANPLLKEIDAVATRIRTPVKSEPVGPSRGDPSRLGLTSMEAEVLALVGAGANRQTGIQLFVSEKSASGHVSNILRRLGMTSRIEASAVAQRLGMT
jgi:DNA-binding CsgD family transcriptional regulator